MNGHVDEETPLLVASGKKRPTPLPWFQFTIVLFLQLPEPLSSNVIYPFAPQLIRDIGITHGNEGEVGYYVGLMQSIFFVAQALTILHWSRMSDRIGRKPVIMMGLLGLSLSMFCFGLSKTFWGLVLSRSLNGALNGNIGILKSMVAEMTDSTNISQAYAFIPIAWSTGASLGPVVGGLLALPAERFPDLLGHSAFLKKYPYFLPCAVPATFSLLSCLVTLLFLKETLPAPISVGQLLGITTKRTKPILQTNIGPTDQVVIPPPGLNEEIAQCIDDHTEKPLPLRSLLTPRVLVAAVNYAALSVVDIAFRAIQPVFLSTPIDLGGLELQPPAIGKLMSIYAIINGVFQVFFFTRIHDRWGSKKTFIAGIASAIPVFILFPVANALVRTQGYSATVWTAIGFQVLGGMFLGLAYGAIPIFISAASPNRASLGATNGFSQMMVSVMRAIGPAAANSLFSLSIENRYMGGYAVYYALVVLTCVALALSSLLPRKIWTD